MRQDDPHQIDTADRAADQGDPDGSLSRAAERWAIDATDDELAAAIIDRDEMLAGSSDPSATVERQVFRQVQFSRDLMRRAESAQSAEERLRSWAEDASDEDLSQELAKNAADHRLAPASNTEADLSVLEEVRDARIAARAKASADVLFPEPQQRDDPEAPSSDDRESTADIGTDPPDIVDRAVEIKTEVRAKLHEVEVWSSRGRILPGETGELIGRIHEKAERLNAVIEKVDKLEEAEILYDASVSFRAFADVDPMDSAALAKTAGAAVSDFGRLLQKTKLLGLTHLGALLEESRDFFTTVGQMLRPEYRIKRHGDLDDAIDTHESGEKQGG